MRGKSYLKTTAFFTAVFIFVTSAFAEVARLSESNDMSAECLAPAACVHLPDKVMYDRLIISCKHLLDKKVEKIKHGFMTDADIERIRKECDLYNRRLARSFPLADKKLEIDLANFGVQIIDGARMRVEQKKPKADLTYSSYAVLPRNLNAAIVKTHERMQESKERKKFSYNWGQMALEVIKIKDAKKGKRGNFLWSFLLCFFIAVPRMADAAVSFSGPGISDMFNGFWIPVIVGLSFIFVRCVIDGFNSGKKISAELAQIKSRLISPSWEVRQEASDELFEQGHWHIDDQIKKLACDITDFKLPDNIKNRIPDFLCMLVFQEGKERVFASILDVENEFKQNEKDICDSFGKEWFNELNMGLTLLRQKLKSFDFDNVDESVFIRVCGLTDLFKSIEKGFFYNVSKEVLFKNFTMMLAFKTSSIEGVKQSIDNCIRKFLSALDPLDYPVVLHLVQTYVNDSVFYENIREQLVILAEEYIKSMESVYIRKNAWAFYQAQVEDDFKMYVVKIVYDLANPFLNNKIIHWEINQIIEAFMCLGYEAYIQQMKDIIEGIDNEKVKFAKKKALLLIGKYSFIADKEEKQLSYHLLPRFVLLQELVSVVSDRRFWAEHALKNKKLYGIKDQLKTLLCDLVNDKVEDRAYLDKALFDIVFYNPKSLIDDYIKTIMAEGKFSLKAELLLRTKLSDIQINKDSLLSGNPVFRDKLEKIDDLNKTDILALFGTTFYLYALCNDEYKDIISNELMVELLHKTGAKYFKLFKAMLDAFPEILSGKILQHQKKYFENILCTQAIINLTNKDANERELAFEFISDNSILGSDLLEIRKLVLDLVEEDTVLSETAEGRLKEIVKDAKTDDYELVAIIQEIQWLDETWEDKAAIHKALSIMYLEVGEVLQNSGNGWLVSNLQEIKKANFSVVNNSNEVRNKKTRTLDILNIGELELMLKREVILDILSEDFKKKLAVSNTLEFLCGNCWQNVAVIKEYLLDLSRKSSDGNFKKAVQRCINKMDRFQADNNSSKIDFGHLSIILAVSLFSFLLSGTLDVSFAGGFSVSPFVNLIGNFLVYKLPVVVFFAGTFLFIVFSVRSKIKTQNKKRLINADNKKTKAGVIYSEPLVHNNALQHEPDVTGTRLINKNISELLNRSGMLTVFSDVLEKVVFLPKSDMPFGYLSEVVFKEGKWYVSFSGKWVNEENLFKPFIFFHILYAGLLNKNGKFQQCNGEKERVLAYFYTLKFMESEYCKLFVEQGEQKAKEYLDKLLSGKYVESNALINLFREHMKCTRGEDEELSKIQKYVILEQETKSFFREEISIVDVQLLCEDFKIFRSNITKHKREKMNSGIKMIADISRKDNNYKRAIVLYKPAKVPDNLVDYLKKYSNVKVYLYSSPKIITEAQEKCGSVKNITYFDDNNFCFESVLDNVLFIEKFKRNEVSILTADETLFWGRPAKDFRCILTLDSNRKLIPEYLDLVLPFGFIEKEADVKSFAGKDALLIKSGDYYMVNNDFVEKANLSDILTHGFSNVMRDVIMRIKEAVLDIKCNAVVKSAA